MIKMIDQESGVRKYCYGLNILAQGVVQKDTSARYPEVLSRVWLQLMCCTLLINQVPNFQGKVKGQSEVREKSEIGNLC